MPKDQQQVAASRLLAEQILLGSRAASAPLTIAAVTRGSALLTLSSFSDAGSQGMAPKGS